MLLAAAGCGGNGGKSTAGGGDATPSKSTSGGDAAQGMIGGEGGSSTSAGVTDNGAADQTAREAASVQRYSLARAIPIPTVIRAVRSDGTVEAALDDDLLPDPPQAWLFLSGLVGNHMLGIVAPEFEVPGSLPPDARLVRAQIMDMSPSGRFRLALAPSAAGLVKVGERLVLIRPWDSLSAELKVLPDIVPLADRSGESELFDVDDFNVFREMRVAPEIVVKRDGGNMIAIVALPYDFPDDNIQRNSNINVAMTQFEIFEEALDVYRLDVGSYPTTSQGLYALLAPPGDLPNPAKWQGPYLRKRDLPLDPWDNPYQYELLGPDQVRIWSFGPDQTDNSGDEIDNSVPHLPPVVAELPEGPELFPVQGKLTIAGRPPKGVLVHLYPFDPIDNPVGSGRCDEAGDFALLSGVEGRAGAAPGRYKVVLAQVDQSAEDYAKGLTGRSGGRIGLPPPPDGPRPTFHAKYLHPATSDKQVVIEKKANTLRLDVDSVER